MLYVRGANLCLSDDHSTDHNVSDHRNHKPCIASVVCAKLTGSAPID